MSGLFRSVAMTHVQLIMTEEGAGNTFQSLGSFKKCHIIDRGVHDSAFFKKHKKRHMDCSQWEKKLQNLRDAMVANGVTPPQPDVDPDDTFKPSGDILESVEGFVSPVEADLNTHINFKREHLQSINEEVERAYVLQWMKKDNQSLRQGLPEPEEKEATSEEAGNGDRIKARNIVGAILVDKQTLFERMVFRVSKGRNALIRFSPIDALIADPATPTGELVKKTVFSCVFVGEQLNKRIHKICALFNARTYEIPENNKELDNQLDEIRTSLAEKHEVLAKTNERITKILESVAKDSAGGSPLVNWEWVIRKERMICEALKKCYVPRVEEVGSEVRREAGQQMVVARVWVPTDEKDTLSSYLREASKISGQQNILQEVATAKAPPTYFRTGKITGSFQAIVDTYGIPRYQEANPGLFTCVTFPFLFGVMYGDVFHGTFLTLFGLYLVLNEKKFLYQEKMGKLGEIFGMCFGGRYLVLLMGLFAIYCGSLYNDCAAVPMNVWGSRWKQDPSTGLYTQTGVYPWGIDPTWAHKANELQFFNSVKMKLAIVLGVTQMCFGVLLGLFNNLYFKRYTAVYFEFFPRMLFMLCTFGYMAFIIVYKMFVDWSSPSAGAPPSLISVMIGMFLSPGHVSDDITLYPGQAGMQVFLLLVALISVPMMLFPLPCINRHLFKKRYGTSKAHLDHHHHDADEEKQAEDSEGAHPHGHPHAPEEEEEEGGHGHGELGPHYDFADHLINLSIHTVEFVLGSVSNTASYLRLWALSLAHAQLAKVFWEKILQQYGFENGGFFSMIGFGAWAGATIAVLLCMDTLECFLHALRLHWVEFQNKFFYADGYAFTPFDFEKDEKTA